MKNRCKKIRYVMVALFFLTQAQRSEANPCDAIIKNNIFIAQKRYEIKLKQNLLAHANDRNYLYQTIRPFKDFMAVFGTIGSNTVFLISLSNIVKSLRNGIRITKEGSVVTIASATILAFSLYCLLTTEQDTRTSMILLDAIKEYTDELRSLQQNYDDLNAANLNLAKKYGCYIPTQN